MPDFIPMRFKARDGVLVPVGDRMRELYRTQLREGQMITLEPIGERSMASHRAYFAELRDIWENRPEYLEKSPHLASVEHMRAWALVSTGFCHTKMYACGSQAEAQKAKDFVEASFRFLYTYVLVTIKRVFKDAVNEETGEVDEVDDGYIVTSYIPMSQAVKAMGKDVFNESKNAVLEHCHKYVLGIDHENRSAGCYGGQ